MTKYLDSDGLAHLWEKLKSFFVAQSKIANNATTTESGFVLDARTGKVLSDQITELNAQIKSLNTSLANKASVSDLAALQNTLASHSALHVLPLSDIADAQIGFNIQYCNVAIQGKIILCWISFGMNNITVPQWNDFAIAKLKSGYYPAKVNPHYPVGIINDQVTGLSASLRVVNNTIAMNTHNIVFDKSGWCWGFVAYVLA